jgi:hypothetical protein
MLQAFTTAERVQVDKTVGNTAECRDGLFRKERLSNDADEHALSFQPTAGLWIRARRTSEAGEVIQSPARLKWPWEVDGRPLWCVAATYDIGFERDQRNNGVTHKIDPAIDGEGEYVNGTLSGTGLVVQRDHVTPVDPLRTAKTATGGEFHSDGRILVLVLRNTTSKSN